MKYVRIYMCIMHNKDKDMCYKLFFMRSMALYLHNKHN